MDLSNIVAGGVGLALAAAAAQYLSTRGVGNWWPFKASNPSLLTKCLRCHREVIPFGSASPVCAPCVSRVVGLPVLGLFAPSAETPPETPEEPETEAISPLPRRCRYKRCTRRDVERLFGGQD